MYKEFQGDKLGYFKPIFLRDLHNKCEVGKGWWKMDKSWAHLKQLLDFHTKLNCTFSVVATNSEW